MANIKRMCKAAKDGVNALDESVIEQVRKPKYICRKCLRTASDKKLLCKPEKIKKAKAADED